MRSLVACFILLAACDLQPPERRAPAGSAGSAAAPTPPAPADAAVTPTRPTPKPAPAPATAPARVEAEAGSGSAVPSGAGNGPAPSEPCLKVGVHIAQVLIDDEKDPQKKATFAQERTQIVRRASLGCTQNAWPEPARTCFLAAKSVAAIEQCTQLIKPR